MPCWSPPVLHIMNNARPIVEALLTLESPTRLVQSLQSPSQDCMDWSLVSCGWEQLGPHPSYYIPKVKTRPALTAGNGTSPTGIGSDTPLGKSTVTLGKKQQLSNYNDIVLKRRGVNKHCYVSGETFEFYKFWQVTDGDTYRYKNDNQVYYKLKLRDSNKTGTASVKRSPNGITTIPHVELITSPETPPSLSTETPHKSEPPETQYDRFLNVKNPTKNGTLLLVQTVNRLSDPLPLKTSLATSTPVTQKKTRAPSAEVRRLPPLEIPLAGMTVDTNKLTERLVFWNEEFQRDILSKADLRNNRGWLDRVKDEVNQELSSELEPTEDGLKIHSILHTCSQECDCNRYPDHGRVCLRATATTKEEKLRSKHKANLSLRKPRPNNTGPSSGGGQPPRMFAWSTPTPPTFRYSYSPLVMPASGVAGSSPYSVALGAAATSGFCSNALGQLKIREWPSIPSIPTDPPTVGEDPALEAVPIGELSGRGLLCSEVTSAPNL